MGLLVALLLAVVLLGGMGFVMHILWAVAVVMFFVWLISVLARGAFRSRRRRWL
jgi:hypothetical protein